MNVVSVQHLRGHFLATFPSVLLLRKCYQHILDTRISVCTIFVLNLDLGTSSSPQALRWPCSWVTGQNDDFNGTSSGESLNLHTIQIAHDPQGY